MPEQLPLVATCLLLDKEGKLLVYQRDNKPTIPFPNHWDLFGGIVENGETPEQALVREIQEELGIRLENFQKFRVYTCLIGDVRPNVKHIFWAKIDANAEELTLREGQELHSIALSDREGLKFANILGKIVDDFSEWYVEQTNAVSAT